MSSVPVQFLVYVLPTPDCATPPELTVAMDCFEAQVGVPFSFTITAINKCDPSDSRISDILVSTNIPGVQAGSLVQASDKLSASIQYTWTPQSNQLGPQMFCTTAFTTSVPILSRYALDVLYFSIF